MYHATISRQWNFANSSVLEHAGCITPMDTVPVSLTNWGAAPPFCSSDALDPRNFCLRPKDRIPRRVEPWRRIRKPVHPRLVAGNELVCKCQERDSDASAELTQQANTVLHDVIKVLLKGSWEAVLDYLPDSVASRYADNASHRKMYGTRLPRF